MKKTGFTLAEVLITLAIIGVVATLTLPALMQNTQEQQAKTALKKGINTLTEMANMNQAVDGFDYGTIANDDVEERDASQMQSLYALIATRGNVDYNKSGKIGEGALKNDAGYIVQAGAMKSHDATLATHVITLRDGSSLYFKPEDTILKNGEGQNGEMLDDGLVRGFRVIYDTNGAKGPNIVSNCTANAAGDLDPEKIKFEDQVGDDGQPKEEDASCVDKKNRVIRDQFVLRLRGGYALPGGPAATWAFEN